MDHIGLELQVLIGLLSLLNKLVDRWKKPITSPDNLSATARKQREEMLPNTLLSESPMND